MLQIYMQSRVWKPRGIINWQRIALQQLHTGARTLVRRPRCVQPDRFPSPISLSSHAGIYWSLACSLLLLLLFSYGHSHQYTQIDEKQMDQQIEIGREKSKTGQWWGGVKGKEGEGGKLHSLKRKEEGGARGGVGTGFHYLIQIRA